MDEKERREGTGKTVHLRGKDKKDMVFARCKADEEYEGATLTLTLRGGALARSLNRIKNRKDV